MGFLSTSREEYPRGKCNYPSEGAIYLTKGPWKRAKLYLRGTASATSCWPALLCSLPPLVSVLFTVLSTLNISIPPHYSDGSAKSTCCQQPPQPVLQENPLPTSCQASSPLGCRLMYPKEKE